jgi:hypothetical protein
LKKKLPKIECRKLSIKGTVIITLTDRNGTTITGILEKFRVFADQSILQGKRPVRPRKVMNSLLRCLKRQIAK